MNKIGEKEYVEILKSLDGNENNPVKAKEIYAELQQKYGDRAPKAQHTVDRTLRKLLMGEPGADIDDSTGIGYKDRGDYYLGFKKKNKKITGYWYKKKIVEDDNGPAKELARFLSDAVIYSKVLNPEYKPDYYVYLQSLFGAGYVKNKDDFAKSIIDFKPYSEDGGIDVMENVINIQQAIDENKKIRFKLGVYKYKNGKISLDMSVGCTRCVSPFQIMMSNGRYYLMAKNKKVKYSGSFLFYRIDLMDEIEVLKNEKADEIGKKEWENPQKFMTAYPYFYSGDKEDIVIGFEEQQITQVVDWFGTEENRLYQILGTYYTEKNDKTPGAKVKMLKLKFPEVNVMSFSFWVMQYIDNIEILEGESLKKILKERMESALKNRIK